MGAGEYINASRDSGISGLGALPQDIYLGGFRSTRETNDIVR